MSKTTAPLLSFDAAGQVGSTVVYSRWRGVKYARRYTIPANPNTVAQQTVRSCFALMREMWKVAPQLVMAPWDAFAKGRPFTGMNKWVGENVRVLQGQANMDDFIGSPGAGGGLPPTGVTIGTSTADQLTVDVVAPPAPDGWTLEAAVAFAFPNQDPSGFFNDQIVAAEDTVGPAYSVALAGLTVAGPYVVCAYLRWMKPTGELAYSVGTTLTATPT